MKKIISLSFAVLLLGTSIGSAADLTEAEQEEYGRRTAGQKMTKDGSRKIIDEIIAERAPLKTGPSRGKMPTKAAGGDSDDEGGMFTTHVTKSEPVEVPDVIGDGRGTRFSLGPISQRMLGKTTLAPRYLAELAADISNAEITDKDSLLRKAQELESLQAKREDFLRQKEAMMAKLGVEPSMIMDDDGETVPDLTAKSTTAMAGFYKDEMFKPKVPGPVGPKARVNLGASGALLDFMGKAVESINPAALKALSLAEQVEALTQARNKLSTASVKAGQLLKTSNPPPRADGGEQAKSSPVLNAQHIAAIDAQIAEMDTLIAPMQKMLDAEKDKIVRWTAAEKMEKEKGFFSKIQAIYRTLKERLSAAKDYAAMMADVTGEEVPVVNPTRDAYVAAELKRKAELEAKRLAEAHGAAHDGTSKAAVKK